MGSIVNGEASERRRRGRRGWWKGEGPWVKWEGR